jgi:dTDP-4-amino-4,6-dideoxygalactose transaminase
MIPYYSPNFGFLTLIRAIFTFKPHDKIIKYFQEHTTKKYILITGSCRAALYLAHSVMNHNGKVLTSPLTCKTAIDPIVSAGNIPIYSDINIESLTIDPLMAEKHFTSNIVSFQLIHFGGVPANPQQFRELCDINGIPMIEDCAQGFFARENGVLCGSFGDISCFSLIKNAYGIGGGIFATNNIEYYKKAKLLQKSYSKLSNVHLLFRILRNLIESYRNYSIGNFIYLKFISLRNKSIKKVNIKHENFLNHLTIPSNIELKIGLIQLKRAEKLNLIRKRKAFVFLDLLNKENLYENSTFKQHIDPAYTKLYLYHSKFNSLKDIPRLNSKGIEAKHLEQKIGVYYQSPLVNTKQTKDFLPVYSKVHDSLISIPLTENMSVADMNKTIRVLKKIINE